MIAVALREVSVALECRTFGVSETCYRYDPKLEDQNERLADLLPVSAQQSWPWLEPQAGLTDQPVTGAEPSHQAAQAP